MVQASRPPTPVGETGDQPDQRTSLAARSSTEEVPLIVSKQPTPPLSTVRGFQRFARKPCHRNRGPYNRCRFRVSTADPEARHIHKTTHQRTDGFKGHLAFEPESGLFTAITLRPGSGTDHTEGAVALDLLADETGPLDVFGDTAYSGGRYRAALTAAGHRIFCKPAPLKPAVPGGFTLDDFHIDTTAGTVTCPAGHTVPLGDPAGQHLQRKAFFGELCTHCPLRSRCTKNKLGRILTIRPHHDQQAAARRQTATDPDWQAAYRRWRPPVERGVAWLVARGNRRLRYHGTLKNDTWLHHRAAALNLRRLINLGLTQTDETWTIAPAAP